ncbi:hypothetical protein G6045_26555 [Streptomyces sp. YC504]|uniref:Uncharacterized protein n=1 Tax=Streptomyces mesophilus TaxID=1775132 RepID=A0A6G4XNN1_9ACTN|nr:hypothetical protein [Streptomyces mesophilus]NGO79186.1 hypothetical protein [Streptomyces mesophilus]
MKQVFQAPDYLYCSDGGVRVRPDFQKVEGRSICEFFRSWFGRWIAANVRRERDCIKRSRVRRLNWVEASGDTGNLSPFTPGDRVLRLDLKPPLYDEANFMPVAYSVVRLKEE